MFQDVSRRFKMFQDVPRCFKMTGKIGGGLAQKLGNNLHCRRGEERRGRGRKKGKKKKTKGMPFCNKLL